MVRNAVLKQRLLNRSRLRVSAVQNSDLWILFWIVKYLYNLRDNIVSLIVRAPQTGYFNELPVPFFCP